MIASLFALALFAAAPGPDAAPAARFDAADRAYLASDFQAAARGYEQLLADGWESPALHLNLGNARYRMGQRGAAIASYSRALRLDPGDVDARANLDLARAGNPDEDGGIEARPLLLRAAERVADGVALAGFALAWLGLWAALAARRHAGASHRGALGIVAGAAALFSVGCAALLAGKAAARAAPVAIVVVSSTPVREGAEAALQPTFELHEGTEVRVLDLRGDAVHVRLGNGREGWVKAVDLEGV